MAVPKYYEFYNALLSALADGTVKAMEEIRPVVSEAMQLSEADLNEYLANGKRLVFRDRLNWAATYLKKAGLISSPARAHFQITTEGKLVLDTHQGPITNDFLDQYPSFRAFRQPSGNPTEETTLEENTPTISASEDTPQDAINAAVAKINANLADDLMAEIMSHDPIFFERLVVDLLRKMGYGGSLSDAGIVTKASGDGGIDGIIKEDKLGFDRIYIQAKRWDPESTVSRPEIQKFSGALRDEGASKGLFITTAKFSTGAKESADKQHIVLVDGNMLTKLMIEYGLGVSTVQTYEIKTIDSDFFHED